VSLHSMYLRSTLTDERHTTWTCQMDAHQQKAKSGMCLKTGWCCPLHHACWMLNETILFAQILQQTRTWLLMHTLSLFKIARRIVSLLRKIPRRGNSHYKYSWRWAHYANGALCSSVWVFTIVSSSYIFFQKR